MRETPFGQQDARVIEHPNGRCNEMPKLEPHQQQEEEREEEWRQEGEEGENRDVDQHQQQPPQLGQLQVRQQRLVGPCSIFTILTLLLLLIGCVTLGIYTTVNEQKVNLEWRLWLSNAEVFSISDMTHNKLRWYAGSVCIEKLENKDYQEEVEVSLEKRSCSDIKRRNVQKNITRNDIHHHQLSFFWTAGTKIFLQMSIVLSAGNTRRYLADYIIDTVDERRECVAHALPVGHLPGWQFNLNGTSSGSVNCTKNNVTAECSSTVTELGRTHRYLLCMQLSKYDGSRRPNLSFHLLINGEEYQLGEAAPSDTKKCQLNETDCCIDYGNILEELYEPTCTFVHNSAPASDVEANELSFPLVIKLHKKRDVVIVSWVLVAATVLALVLAVSCITGRIKYRRAHPDHYCLELKIAGRSCIRM